MPRHTQICSAVGDEAAPSRPEASPDSHPLAGSVAAFDPARHVVIAGPTASGKSALALALARAQGGIIVNADALQIWSCWRVLTARPSAEDEAATPHRLYGHVAPGCNYSVGDWLAEVAALLASGERLIIAGGTGLYLTALTEGLAPIPPTPHEIRAQADRRLAEHGLPTLVAELDARTAGGLDLANPARVQRAWEVLRATGRGLREWQDDTPPPLLGAEAQRVVLTPRPDWLASRIESRFDQMVANGAVDEVRGALPIWKPRAQWTRAIGAPEIKGWIDGRSTWHEARGAAIIATRQYAKSQRSWFRNRMRAWAKIDLP